MGFCFTWTIQNFSLKKEMLRSPRFTMEEGTESETNWLLGLYPSVVGSGQEEYVSLYLSMETCQSDDVTASYAMSIVHKTNGKSKTRHGRNTFKWKQPHGFMEYVKRRDLMDDNNGLLIGDALKIICEIFTDDGYYSIPKTPVGDSNEYWQLYRESRLVDTIIDVKSTEFRVHKVILAAQSQVFESMFSHMMESSTNQIRIDDCDPEVFAEIVRFVYTKKVENVQKLARDLLVCADKYGLEKLKKVCETSIGEELTKCNAAKILILADTYKADRLKRKTLEYISHRASYVTKADEWEVMLDYPKLLNEVVKSMANLSLKTSRRMLEERRASGFFMAGLTKI